MTISDLAERIAYVLTEKGRRPVRTLAYHPLSDDWRVFPWDCRDPGSLTEAEACNVLGTHGACGPECRISRTARNMAGAGRDAAFSRGDLRATLRFDDVLESAGMDADQRQTCARCKDWADHAHYWRTGARMTLAEFDTRYGTDYAAQWQHPTGAIEVVVLVGDDLDADQTAAEAFGQLGELRENGWLWTEIHLRVRQHGADIYTDRGSLAALLYRVIDWRYRPEAIA